MLFDWGYLCGGCGRRFKRNEVAYKYRLSCICKECFSQLKKYSNNACFEAKGRVDFLTPVFEYKGIYRDLFLKFKFNGNIAYGHILGQAIYDNIKGSGLFSDYDYIVPVPLSKIRFYKRGYNQSRIMAEYVSEALGISVLDALKRTKNSVSQSSMKTSDKANNVKDSFVATRRFNGERLVLFDDIYTTGSTASECAEALINAGADGVCCISGAYIYREMVDWGVHRFLR